MGIYGFGESMKNMFSLIYTKIFWPQARLMRLPIYIRNKKNVVIKKGFTSGYSCRINAGKQGKVYFGENFCMGDYVQIEAHKSVIFGDNVLLASRIYIGDASHGQYVGLEQASPEIPPIERPIVTEEIRIGNNVWIGNGVSILSGVSIGNGSIIGANSVVTKDIPENCIAVGIPAKVIKKYSVDNWKAI